MAILPTRATLLTQRLGALRDWSLVVSCPCRGFPRHLPLAALADDRGNRPILEDVLARLRCAKCGQAPLRVEARTGDPLAARRPPGVVLLESRAAVDRNRG